MEPIVTYVHPLRSRYSETDQMGYVYHGRFLEYFEAARTEFIREAGFTYQKLEETGVMMPVVSVTINYRKPVFYDELIHVILKIYREPTVKLETHYEVVSAETKELKAEGKVILCFVDAANRKLCHAPESFLKAVREFLDNGL